MIERIKVCPKCSYHLLAISGKDVICLSPNCNWRTEARRESDKELPKLTDIRGNWQ